MTARFPPPRTRIDDLTDTARPPTRGDEPSAPLPPFEEEWDWPLLGTLVPGSGDGSTTAEGDEDLFYLP